jgi:hypothetical protein
MPFHIEIGSPVDRIRVTDLAEAELHEQVLEPWTIGLPFDFGGRTWAPRESRLTVLSGPAAAGGDSDQAWEAMLRAASDVTRPQLEAAEASAPVQVAAVVEASTLESALKTLRHGRPPQQVHWAAAMARLRDRDSDVTAVILVVKRPEGQWPRL